MPHAQSTRRPLVIEGGDPALAVSLKRFKPIPDAGIEAAVAAMRAGDTFRYAMGSPDASQVSRFEREFAEHLGSRHAVAVNSCGSALFLALRGLGVRPGDAVLLNAFTFTAVPSAIVHAGATPVLVESDRGWRVDAADLDRMAAESGAKVLLLSYMRGHVPDMDAVLEVCRRRDLILIEDCAHALCTRWRGREMGRFGQAACFSAQSSKALSAGEGGVLATDDDELAARVILMSGSYEQRWRHHAAAPAVLPDLEGSLPGFSLRMGEVVGAMLRPQVPRLAELERSHRRKHRLLVSLLRGCPSIEVPPALPHAEQLGDTLQFHLVGLSPAQADRVIELAALEGLPMQIFGRARNARDYRNWGFVPAPRSLPSTLDAIAFACDLTLGQHLDERHIHDIADGLWRICDYVRGEG